MGGILSLAYDLQADLFDNKSADRADGLPPFDKINHADLLAIPLSNNTTNLTHGFHRFPAKFIPQVPRWAIQEFSSEGDYVLDPFAGSGTTLVEAIASNRVSLGIDLDPLNALICKTKTTPLESTRLHQLAAEVLGASLCPAEFQSKMSGVKNFEHWFAPQVARQLQSIYSAIEDLACSADERRFFFVAFSSILRWASNADDQSQKTYVSGTSKKDPPDPRQLFKRQLLRNIRGMEGLSKVAQLGESCVIQGSASFLPLKDQQVDLIVTSPPYLDSVDYMYNFMVEYFWLGPQLGVESRDAWNRLRKLPLGGRQSQSSPLSLPEVLADLVNLDLILPYRRRAVEAYFALMAQHFQEAARVVRSGGKYVLVIGNSQSNNGYVPVHDCLVRLAGAAGFGLVKAFAYRIRRHYMKFPRKGRGGIILMDWIVVLERGAKGLVNSRLPQPDVSISPDAVAH